jgi:hypothetical protein
MKRLIFTFAALTVVSSFAYAGYVSPSVLSSRDGKFVLGSIETGAGVGADRRLFMIDTSNGQVWQQGCILVEDGKCLRVGLRPLGISDGQNGEIFDNAEAWSHANDFGKMLRESKGAPAKK